MHGCFFFHFPFHYFPDIAVIETSCNTKSLDYSRNCYINNVFADVIKTWLLFSDE